VYRIYLDGEGHISDDTVLELGAFLPMVCETPSKGGEFIGAWALPASGSAVKLWVAYSPRANSPIYGEPNAGLLELTAQLDDGVDNTVGTEDDGVTFEYGGKTAAFEDASTDDPASLLTYAVLHGAIVAAYSCTGVAAFSTGDSPPSLLGTWVDDPAVSYLDCVTGEDSLAWVTSLDGRIHVFDPNEMESGPIATFETQSQAAALYPTASTVSGNPPPPAFFLADFAGGVSRVQFSTEP
jgi:hypothetical protein